MKNAKSPRQRRTGISQARTYEEIGQFWDVHDLADAAPAAPSASFTVAARRKRFLIALEPSLAGRLRERALRAGLSSESLLNLWLEEKLAG